MNSNEQICLKRLCFVEILLSSSDPRPNRMREVSGIAASLNAFVHNVINNLYVQDLVLALASKIKMKNNGKKKEKF